MTGIDLRTGNLLGALALALMDGIRAEISELSAQGETDCAALVTIGHESGLSIDRLAAILGLSQPGAVRLVDRLQREGLVERRAGADRRTRALVLSAAGQRQMRGILLGRERAIRRALDAISPAERGVLAGVLEKMLGALTVTEAESYSICRLCDEGVCPPARCPVECAAPAAMG